MTKSNASNITMQLKFALKNKLQAKIEFVKALEDLGYEFKKTCLFGEKKELFIQGFYTGEDITITHEERTEYSEKTSWTMIKLTPKIKITLGCPEMSANNVIKFIIDRSPLRKELAQLSREQKKARKKTGFLWAITNTLTVAKQSWIKDLRNQTEHSLRENPEIVSQVADFTTKLLNLKALLQIEK